MFIYTISPCNSSYEKCSGGKTAPINFDAATHPIISRHWFGIDPPRQITQATVDVAAFDTDALELAGGGRFHVRLADEAARWLDSHREKQKQARTAPSPLVQFRSWRAST